MTEPSPSRLPERGLLALAIRRPVGVSMIVLALLVFGVVGYTKLPVNLLPELSYPTVTIRTEFPGASPEDVEDRISEPVREAVSVLASVVKVTSISRSGQSDVIVEFGWGTQMLHAVGDIREKLDRAFLPPEVEPPLILRYDPSLDPMMTLGLGGERDPMELRFRAEEEIEQELAIDGVAAVKVKGGDEKEILIALDPTMLTSLNLDIREIAQRIGAENLNASAGSLEEGETEYLVRAMNEFRNLTEVRELIVARRGATNIRLGEIARVLPRAKEKDVITRIDGKPAVLIEIYKSADANLVAVAAALKERISGTREQQEYVAELARKGKPRARKPEAGVLHAADRGETDQASAAQSDAGSKQSGNQGKNESTEQKKKKKGEGRGHEQRERMRHVRMTDFIRHQLPQGMKLDILTDPSRYIRNAIQEVLESALVGGLLAVFVLYLFLRQARPTFLISLAIPLSLVVTFAPLYQAHVSLNVMSLGGLALGVGMLVDTSIVVLESITRCREEGDSPIQAAFRGVREVSSAVIASTLTTVAVFLPIVFVEGIAGQLFRDQALAVVFSLIVALLVSLFLLPMLAGRGGPPRMAPQEAEPSKWRAVRGVLKVRDVAAGVLPWIWFRAARALAQLGGLLMYLPAKAFNSVYRPIEKAYPLLLAGALRFRILVVLLSLGAVALGAWRFGALGSEVMPEVHQGEFITLVFLDRTVKVEKTDRIVDPIERAIRRLPGVERTFVTAGVARDELRSSEEGKHSARIHVVLDPQQDVVSLEDRTRREIRRLLARQPAVETYRFEVPTLFSVNTPISVEILGHNLANLRRTAALVEKRLKQVPEIRDVRSTLGRGNTEVVVRFDREKLAQVGLPIGEAARRLAAFVQGEVPTRFAEREKKIDVRVRLDPAEVEGTTRLRELDLADQSSTTPILLSAVADLLLLEGPSEVRRLGNRRGAEVQGTVSGLDLGRVQQSAEAALSRLDLPPGIELRFGGQKVEMERSRESMIEALMLAIFLVYVVMAAQFESLVQPLVIIFTVPLAVVGVVLTLDLLEIPLSVVVFLGGIMLAGIVVNNAIVMIDRMNQERARGKTRRQAILDGATVRLRPVLMTTATTVLGLLPLTGWISLRLFGGAGEGVELRAPMAITVISGLLFATVLTLVVIPVIYSFAVRETEPAEAS